MRSARIRNARYRTHTHGYHHASGYCPPRSAAWRRLVRPWTLVRQITSGNETHKVVCKLSWRGPARDDSLVSRSDYVGLVARTSVEADEKIIEIDSPLMNPAHRSIGNGKGRRPAAGPPLLARRVDNRLSDRGGSHGIAIMFHRRFHRSILPARPNQSSQS
jgi:hypothetical protein